MSRTKKAIDYLGTGFLVKLLGFPTYVDDGEYMPDAPLGRLHKAIAYEIIKNPHLLTGNELAFLRAQASLSRSEMARRMGVTRRTLINWEETLDDPIKASLIAQLGIRCVCAVWIFPTDNSFPREIADSTLSSDIALISINYSKFTAENVAQELGDAAEPNRARHIA